MKTYSFFAQAAKANLVSPGFEQCRIETDIGLQINVLTGGQGSPLLMLHGHPQTHAMWHKVAPALAERHALMLAELRGYGDSSKPKAGNRWALLR